MDNYHLSHKGDEWQLEKQHAERVTKKFPGMTKEEAVRDAAKFLRNRDDSASLKIHLKDGPIQEERTYPKSADPTQSPG